VSNPGGAALIGRSTQVLASLGHHRRIQQYRDRIGQSLKTMFFQQFHCIVNRSMLDSLSHSCFSFCLQSPQSLSEG